MELLFDFTSPRYFLSISKLVADSWLDLDTTIKTSLERSVAVTVTEQREAVSSHQLKFNSIGWGRRTTKLQLINSTLPNDSLGQPGIAV